MHLQDKKLKYYKHLGAKHRCGVFNFDHFLCTCKVSKDPLVFVIQIVDSSRIFEFRTKSIESTINWVKNISQHILESTNGTPCSGLKKPWKFDHVSESQFLAKADTGDILLFRGSHAGSKLTRAVTNSYFDHVGMVVRFENDPNEVYFLEATGNMGVSLSRWNFIKKHVGPSKFYRKIIFRHVNFNREKVLNDLQ